jgi:hypothetical protein
LILKLKGVWKMSQKQSYDPWWQAVLGLLGLGVVLAIAIILLRIAILTKSRIGFIILLLAFLVAVYFRSIYLNFISWAIKILNQKKPRI